MYRREDLVKKVKENILLLTDLSYRNKRGGDAYRLRLMAGTVDAFNHKYGDAIEVWYDLDKAADFLRSAAERIEPPAQRVKVKEDLDRLLDELQEE